MGRGAHGLSICLGEPDTRGSTVTVWIALSLTPRLGGCGDKANIILFNIQRPFLSSFFHTNIPSSYLPSSLLDWLRPLVGSRDLPAPPPLMEWTTVGGRLQLWSRDDSEWPDMPLVVDTDFFNFSAPPVFRRLRSLNRSLE